MATRMLRRGLPREAGGEPWPPAGDVEVADAAAPAVAPSTAQEVSVAEPQASVAESGPRAPEAPAGASATGGVGVGIEVSDTAAAAPSPSTGSGIGQASGAASLRRGLPRTPGGELWPPSDAVAAAAPAASAPAAASPVVEVERAEGETKRRDEPPAETLQHPAAAEPTPTSGTASDLRRGLPRTPGGEAWPPAGTVASVISDLGSGSEETMRVEDAAVAASAESIPSSALATVDVSTPLPFQRTVFPGKNAFNRPAPKPEPERIGPFTKGQWAGAVIIGGGGLLVAAAMAVLFVRWLLSLDPLQDFLQTYPGEYHLPEGAPVGFPSWLGWQHFFNVFLMVLIIRSGLRIRNEKRPTAFWTPRGDSKGKVSLTIWFHQSLDILWLINGVVFIVLLFMTGQWMRVIPTSWEVIPNALSAVLQYISLDWPTENGWVNYNSIQQITYFTTIFIAAPLAAVTGFRMSGMWPKKAEKLSKAYPIEWARALHFPVMLYFVVFIFIHVALVLTTGALRNLNHMYAVQGSTDPTAYADNWTGFWMLVASLVVIAAAWVAARPLVLAPIAKLFGTVSAR